MTEKVCATRSRALASCPSSSTANLVAMHFVHLIALHDHVVEVRRDLAVLETVDRQFDLAGVKGRGGDRVRALRAIGVRRGETHFVVLAGQLALDAISRT